ncbi:MAG TPA: hypothetical protein VEC17_02325 [Candidatus Binatia bacterium]|nr:hypothetical protein [Candidatus Binatia bacterium]
MQKYISVVNPRMDDDDISQLIAKGVAGILFSISHQNYTYALKLIQQVKELSRKYHRPISIIQDVSKMDDPMEMEIGVKGGVHWIATDNHEHMKMARGLNKLIGVINKGRNIKKNVKVDSVMSDLFLDPDAQVLNSRSQIRHLLTSHPKQNILEMISHFAEHSETPIIAASDLDLAKALAWRRAKNKIVYAPEDHRLAEKAAIYRNIHPIYKTGDLLGSLKDQGFVKKGDRFMNATDPRHIEIMLVA